MKKIFDLLDVNLGWYAGVGTMITIGFIGVMNNPVLLLINVIGIGLVVAWLYNEAKKEAKQEEVQQDIEVLREYYKKNA